MRSVAKRAAALLKDGRTVTPSYWDAAVTAGLVKKKNGREVHRWKDGRPRLYLTTAPVNPKWKRLRNWPLVGPCLGTRRSR